MKPYTARLMWLYTEVNLQQYTYIHSSQITSTEDMHRLDISIEIDHDF